MTAHTGFIVALLILPSTLRGAAVPLVSDGQPRATLVLPNSPGALARLAAQEFTDYVEKLSGATLRTITATEAASVAANQSLVFLGSPDSNPAVSSFSTTITTTDLKPEAFRIRTGSWKGRPAAVIAGADDAGTLYGVYELLEQLGVTFRLTGDILPERRHSLELSELDIKMEPALKRRGFLFTVVFDNASCYSWSDYETMLNQMARMKCNYLQFWWFSFQPWVSYSYQGEPAFFGDVSAKESGYQNWAFGGFGSRTADDVMIGKEHFAKYPRLAPQELQHVESPQQALEASTKLLQRVIDHAASRNIKVWLAVEMDVVPPNLARYGQIVGDAPFSYLCGSFLHPLDPVNREIQVARLKALATTYPKAEGIFLNFAELYPDLRSEKHRIFFENKRKEFYEMRRLSIPWLTALASIYDVRVDQAIDSTIGDFDLFQYLLKQRDEVAPELKLGLMTVGRGYGLPFFDKRLPGDIPFASLESEGIWTMLGIPMQYFSSTTNRETIIQARVDDDFDMLGMQFSVRQYAERDRIFLDGVKNGLSGVAGQVERARGTEFNSSYLARASWEPQLTPENFYRISAERMFGKEAASEMYRAFLKLEENQQYLGYYNFDGGYGTLACCGPVREVRAAYKYYRQKNPFGGPTSGAWTNMVAYSSEFIDRREGSIRLLNEALEHLHSAAEKIPSTARQEHDYLVNRTECFRDTFAGLNSIRRGFLLFDNAFRAKGKSEIGEEQLAAQLETSLATVKEGQQQLQDATRKFSLIVDHVSDLAVLYHMNTRLVMGTDLAVQHLANVVAYHQGQPYLKEIPYEKLFPMRPDKGAEE